MKTPVKTNLFPKIALTLCCAATLFSCAHAQPQTPTCIGVNDHIIWRTNADQDVAFAKYADSNTKFLRVGADWNVLQPNAPTAATPSSSAKAYNAHYLDRLDYFFQKCAAAKIRVLICPAYAPDWAIAADTKGQGGWAPDADKTGAYADFCEFLLRRYTAAAYVNADKQHTLEAIEMWNEPDFYGGFFRPFINDGTPDAPNGVQAAATRYAEMVIAAGGRIKAVRGAIGAPDVVVLAPVISNVHNVCWSAPGKIAWLDAFYAVPKVTDNYDVFDWHTYWESAGSWLPTDLPSAWNPTNQRRSVLGQLVAPDAGEIWKKMVAHGDDKKPNWCTEIGGAARAETSDHNPGRLLSLGEQQTHLADVIATLRARKVTNLDRVYWYELFDEPHLFKDKQQGFFGLLALSDSKPIVYSGGQSLASATFTPKPAYEIYKVAEKSSAITPN